MKTKHYKHGGVNYEVNDIKTEILIRLGKLAEKRHYIDTQIAEELKSLQTYIQTGDKPNKKVKK